jgi:4-hydroxybenzoate polyprenyltransferase/phosphoserine phosphatase
VGWKDPRAYGINEAPIKTSEAKEIVNAMDEITKAACDIPLVVDLDRTLIKTNSLHEAFIQLVSQKPIQALLALLMLTHSRADFKVAIADLMLPNPDTIPVNEVVLERIKQARKEGRKVYLATAAPRRFAEAIADSIAEFDGVFASKDGINLKGEAKADRLVTAFGACGFDYIGNDAGDIPAWRVARTAFISGARPHLTRYIRRELPDAIVLGTHDFAIGPYLRALRPHQWLKNILVALPLIAHHDFRVSSVIIVVAAMISFSLGASSIYLINDMLDLPHDRAHSDKRHRPLAAGTVPLSHAAVLFSIVAGLSVAVALMLPRAFMGVLVAYFALSMSYSVYLKRKVMIDVVTLALLYGIRVLAGGAASGIGLSHWLVGFCFFIFLSLALVKRTTEIMTLLKGSVDKISGRGYLRVDLQTITALAAASGFVAVLVLALYINSSDVITLYHHPELLWGICFILVYWLGRFCILTGRGEMDQDPIIFAATDRASLLAGILVLAIFVAAL